MEETLYDDQQADQSDEKNQSNHIFYTRSFCSLLEENRIVIAKSDRQRRHG